MMDLYHLNRNAKDKNMIQLDLTKISALLNEAVAHADDFLLSPKLKEYPKKVAAQLLLRQVRKMIDIYNKAITDEYRKRKNTRTEPTA